MSQHHLEQEEIEKIMGWWKQYGPATVMGIVLGLIIMFSWQHWTEHRQAMSKQASMRYEELLQHYSANQFDVVKTDALQLEKDYESSVYAGMAALFTANVAVMQGDLNYAKDQLKWADAHLKPAVLKEIARIRLARVLAALGETDDALRLLTKNVDNTFWPLADEVRGDILLANHQPNEAKQVYKKALSYDGLSLVTLPFLQMKYDNLVEISHEK